MKEKIEARLKELTEERERRLVELRTQAEQQIAANLAPYDASISELQRLLPAPK